LGTILIFGHNILKTRKTAVARETRYSLCNVPVAVLTLKVIQGR